MTDHPPPRRGRYDRIAGAYASLLQLGSLGRISELYRATAAELDVPAGAVVLDLGCGPATLTPYLLERVGATATVLGVDLAEEMIRQARQRAEREGWKNVRFERGDGQDYVPPEPVDAVVLCLALTTMPEPERCLGRVFASLRPGGQLVVLDSFPDPGRRLASLVIRLKAPLVGAHPTRAPLDLIRERLEGTRVQSFFGGVYSLLSARKPGASPAGAARGLHPDPSRDVGIS